MGGLGNLKPGKSGCQRTGMHGTRAEQLDLKWQVRKNLSFLCLRANKKCGVEIMLLISSSICYTKLNTVSAAFPESNTEKRGIQLWLASLVSYLGCLTSPGQKPWRLRKVRYPFFKGSNPHLMLLNISEHRKSDLFFKSSKTKARAKCFERSTKEELVNS